MCTMYIRACMYMIMLDIIIWALISYNVISYFSLPVNDLGTDHPGQCIIVSSTSQYDAARYTQTLMFENGSSCVGRRTGN